MIFTVNQELIVRLLVFASLLLLMLCWEKLRPRRRGDGLRWPRRLHNLMLIGLDTLVLRLLFPLTAVSVAMLATERQWGLFNYFAVPGWLATVLSFVLLDLLIYLQHRLFHYYGLLWRLHRVHHSDSEFDTTTGVRFHPLEIILSACIKLLAVVLIGAPAMAVLLFEIVLSATSLFNHGNVYLPERVDRYLRTLLVTPDMHRIHHSALMEETNSNFGFNLSCWDHLFCSYRKQPKSGHKKLKIGLNEFRAQEVVHIVDLLKQPLLKKATVVDNADN